MDLLFRGHIWCYWNGCVLVGFAISQLDWSITSLANDGLRFLIEDMTQADLLAEDKAFEMYLKENGWEDGMLENAEHKE